MTFMQPRASYRPIGRQPFRPGQWQGFKGVSRNTTYIQNNFFGSSYNSGLNYNSCFGYGNFNNYGNYGCNCGGGSNKFMNWMLGIGLGTTLLGGIFKLFGIGGNNNTETIQGNESTRRRGNEDSSSRTRRGENSQAEKTDETDGTDETDETDETDDASQSHEADKADEASQTITDVLKVQKKEEKTSTNYNVNYGDTWANIITAKYKDENGNPISFADAKELWTKLKADCGVSKNADGMPSNIELPNEFKNYKLDINGKVTANTNFDNPNYKKYDGKGFTPTSTVKYTATGTINGKSIGNVSGSSTEVTEQLREKGFSNKDIQTAMQNGEVKITKQKEEE